MRMQVKQRTFLCIALAVLVCLLVVGIQNLASGCYGPHITAQVDKSTAELNGVITVTGMVCPAENNKSVRIDFTRPDYTYIDRWTTTDENGNFSMTQQLDMVGYWNIFAIDGHMCDRLHTIVTDPANPHAPLPTPVPLPPYKPNYSVIAYSLSRRGHRGCSGGVWQNQPNPKNQFTSLVCPNSLRTANLHRHIHRPSKPAHTRRADFAP